MNTAPQPVSDINLRELACLAKYGKHHFRYSETDSSIIIEIQCARCMKAEEWNLGSEVYSK